MPVPAVRCSRLHTACPFDCCQDPRLLTAPSVRIDLLISQQHLRTRIMPMMPKTDRLQALLDFTRQANEVEQHRVSLETFLADLQQEREDLDEAQLKQIQVSQLRPSHLPLLIS